MTTILRPSTVIVPLVAYSRPIMQAGLGLLGVGLERAGLAVDQRDLEVVGLRGGARGQAEDGCRENAAIDARWSLLE